MCSLKLKFQTVAEKTFGGYSILLHPVDFDREYLWNGSSNRQVENGVINHDFSQVQRKQFGELCFTNEEMTLTFDHDFEILELTMTLKFNRF